MPKLFGLDIARLVDQSIRSAGGVLTGSLTRAVPGTRTSGSLADGVQPTVSTYSCRGFVETKQSRRSDSTVPASYAQVSVLGASLVPATVPVVNDLVQFGGKRYRLLELLQSDPAEALYVFKGEEA